MEIIYRPYIDPEFEFLIERIYPPWVCIDNDSYKDCTLVKVDSANKNGILLEMVQVLTDLDLVISKSYISSDGGWFMDVFHVTDQLGNKITDESLILYIQQALCASRGGISKEARLAGRNVTPGLKDLALEMTSKDRPGLVSEISAVLVELGCNITTAVAWTHGTRAASIFYVEDGLEGGPITDPIRLAHVQEQLENVVKAHHEEGEKRSVRLTTPAGGHTHKERRLHQLMYADEDYESCRGCDGSGSSAHKKGCDRTHVNIESCKEKGYWIVNVRSRDRPKLLFDTVCALTDLQYVVFHAVVASRGTLADQEYFVRHQDGYTSNTESQRHKLTLCLVAAIERRISQGLRLDLCAKNRMGLLSDITRVFRENGLSMSRIEIGTRGERAVGSIYVTDASGDEVNPNAVELVTKEIGESIIAVHKSHKWAPQPSSSRASNKIHNRRIEEEEEDRPRFSLGSLVWSHLERLSSSFGAIKS
ncbi:PREDICTED: ACT domain-containing protein ACR1 isoform X2 [Prunus mume]|uniref:ACT domain-containing protein ACR n=1 Tax=Prunus mume TaxID=102107 RepID=A0ABM0PCB7_PRUMU|nr:PREDICTED: ACT domain-containing protein ACR1 isoform X2 [Prunus mume]